MATPAKTDSERKTDRMEFRMTPSMKAVINRATAITGLTPADLAYEAARRILDTHETMELTGANAEAFRRALEAPVEAPQALVEALRRHREVVGH